MAASPVLISRAIDTVPLGKRFADVTQSRRPCNRMCIENCEECITLCDSVSEYFSPHPIGLCPACHLFGTPYYKGRLSFGPAWLKSDTPVWYKANENDSPLMGGPLTLPLLEKPRPTWSMPKNHSKIPGRKFYIHHPWSVNRLKGETKTENNRTIEPLGKGNDFEFEVKFHNLREWELGLLIYTLELEDNLAHKIGMGKATGLGSIQIFVEKLSIKEISNEGREIKNIDKEQIVRAGFSNMSFDFKSAYHQQLLSLMWLSPVKESFQVRYPSLEKESNDIPGYIELKEQSKNSSDLLCSPWREWHSFSDKLLKPAILQNKNEGIGDKGELEKSARTGIVKFFNKPKKFGFIEQSSGPDIFVHVSAVNESGYETLCKGEKVQFETKEGYKGLSAVNLVKL
ncbi:MAG: cold shock domain-containing protein [Desulfobacula sp.]|nr:cold shock domain-containing protein [Desulfobacula sp.]